VPIWRRRASFLEEIGALLAGQMFYLFEFVEKYLNVGYMIEFHCHAFEL